MIPEYIDTANMLSLAFVLASCVGLVRTFLLSKRKEELQREVEDSSVDWPSISDRRAWTTRVSQEAELSAQERGVARSWARFARERRLQFTWWSVSVGLLILSAVFAL